MLTVQLLDPMFQPTLMMEVRNVLLSYVTFKSLIFLYVLVVVIVVVVVCLHCFDTVVWESGRASSL